VVTICLVENAILREFIEGRIRRFDPEEEIRFTLQLFYRTSMHYLRYLRDLNAATSEVERKLQRSQKNQDLLELMNNEKSLVYFTTSLRSNQLMMERFKKTAYFRKAIEDERDLLEDIIIDNAQAIEMANIYMSIMSGLMDTFASVISNNLNVVMKRLTKITIILMLPTFVASLYGMNVQLPGAESPYAFAVILALSLVLIVLGFFVFSDRRF